MDIAGNPTPVYETANYEVYVGKRTDKDLPEERRSVYFIRHKQHRVLFETTSQLGGAILACQELQMHIDAITAREGQPAAPHGKAN